MKLITTLFLIFICSLSVSAQNPDINLLKSINLDRNTSLDHSFTLITDSTFPLCAAIPVVMFGTGWYKNDSTLKQNGIMVGTSLLISATVFTSLKYAVGRDRPFVTYPELDNVTFEGTPSFPSGHTASAFSTATSLSLAYPEWYVVVPAYTWAGTVAYTRMHLGVHYPSDVLVGMIIGTGSAYLSYKIQNWMMKYF